MLEIPDPELRRLIFRSRQCLFRATAAASGLSRHFRRLRTSWSWLSDLWPSEPEPKILDGWI